MRWSFYDLQTGQFTGRYFSGRTEDDLSRNTPDGCGAVEGEHDHLSTRFDLDSRQVVDWQPPKPDEDHEWSADRKRWVPTQATVRKQAALAEIRRLERDEQPRAAREGALGLGTERLQAIQDRIVELRAVISTPARPGEAPE